MICTHMDHCYPLDHVDGTPCFCGKRRWNDDGESYAGPVEKAQPLARRLPRIGQTTDAQLETLRLSLGRRYVTDFTVLAIGPGQKVLLAMFGDRYELSAEELMTILERGLVTEAPPIGDTTK